MDVNIQKKSKRHGKGKFKISFDKELVTKDYAKELVLQEQILEIKQTESLESPVKLNKRKKNTEIEEYKGNNIPTKKIRKSDKYIDKNIDGKESIDESKESQPTDGSGKKKSVRAAKRQKHAKLMEDKKLQVELELQQKALNYLSKWKHSKSEWKFEKLRQVWLQQNLFDISKLPNEIWDTAIQYFSGAKGYSRKAVLDLAIKYIEEEEKVLNENADENYQSKLKRARDIVQHLE